MVGRSASSPIRDFGLDMVAVNPKKVAAFTSSRDCGNCGALEDPPGTVLKACVRCLVVFYSSRAKARWSQAILLHSRGAADGGRADRPSHSKTTKHNECAICLEQITSSSADCCTLPYSGVFHIRCARELRSFGFARVLVMCRAELPPEPEQLWVGVFRFYLPVKQRVERSGNALNAVAVLGEC